MTSHQQREQRQRLMPGEVKGALNRIAIRTQPEVAAILLVTPQCVQRIERNALWKLRRALEGWR